MTKCNCIDKGPHHICEWCGPMSLSGKDNQAAEFLAKAKPQIDRNRPERPDLGGGRLAQEFACPGPIVNYSNPNYTQSLPATFSYAGPLSALSLGGVVPFNAIAVILPYAFLPQLNNQATLMALSRAVNQQGALGGFSGYPGVDQFFLMRPGEVINFGKQVNGICGFWAAPWSGMYPLGASDSATDVARSVNSIFNSFSQSASVTKAAALGGLCAYADNGMDNGPYIAGPVFAPQFRVHQTPVQTLSVPVHKAPWVMSHVQFVKPNGAVCIPPGAKTMTVTFHGGGSSFNNPSWQNQFATYPYATDNGMQPGKNGRVAAGQWEVWVDWYGFGGQVHRHPGDYFNPTGRGYVTPDHDIEVFDVPRVAGGVNLYWAGNNPIGTTNINSVTFAFSGGD